MIRMNLQLFAKTKAQQQAYRKTLAIRKQNQPGSKNLEDVMNKEKEEERRKGSGDSLLYSRENITNSETISKKENYVLVRLNENGKEDRRGTRTGVDLKEDIAYERLVLVDRKAGIWEAKKSGRRFVIRRKR